MGTRPGSALTAFFWLVVAFLILPFSLLIPMSLSNADFLRFPPSDFGFRWYLEYLTSPQWLDATLLSVRVAFFSSLIATVTGTAAAFGIERGLKRTKGLVLTIVGSPIVIPHIFIALGIFVLALRLDLLSSEIVLMLAHATLGMPFVVLIVTAQVKQLDTAIERAARILGAGPVRTFFSVTLPTLRPAITAGAVIAFFISFDELTVALFLMSGQETLPMRLWSNMRLDISPVIAAVATILIAVTTVGMLGAELLRRKSVALAR